MAIFSLLIVKPPAPVYLFLFYLSLLLSFSSPTQWKRHHIRGFAQGTTYSIIYYAPDSLLTQQQTDSALLSLDSSLSIYKPYSLISQFNKSAEPILTDKHLCLVVRKSQEVHRKTNGAFDITVMPLVQAWGFGVKKEATLPDSATIRQLLQCVGSEKIKLQKNKLAKTKACVQIDVNGIAQGYSVDVLASLLESRGITNYLVELGGEIRVSGRKKPSDEPMVIGIEAPADTDTWEQPMQQYIYLTKGAVTTSGNYRKFYQSGNKTISHLIHPKTGFPVQNNLIAVTVWAKDAITADGYDNALMVMGLEKALRFAERKKNFEAYFIYRNSDGSVADTATKGFYKLMQKQAGSE